MIRKTKRVALGINLDTSYGRQKVQGILAYMQRHQRWEIPLRHALPCLPDRDLIHWNGDGVITEVYSPEVARNILKQGIPVVNTYSQKTVPLLPTVTLDNLAVGRMAAEHLLQKKIDRFAFVGLKGLRYCMDRFIGFSEVLSQHNYGCDVLWIDGPPLPGRLTKAEPYLQGLRTLKSPIGVFASNDRVGFGVLAACQQLRIPSPDGVALVAVDNDETLCALAAPQMSSIDVSAEQIGYRAAEKLAQMMADEQEPDFWEELQPKGVVQRHSSDVLSVPDPLVAEALRVIRSRYAEGLNVSSVMNAVPGSRRSLERKFRETVGCGIYDEIRSVRVEHAQQLLKETDLSIAKIAKRTGFNSVTRFDITFREITGKSASDYRKAPLRQKRRTRG